MKNVKKFPFLIFLFSVLLFFSFAEKISADIFAFRGNASQGFYLYNTASGNWDTTRTPFPVNVGGGASLVCNGSDYIYALEGNGTKIFYRYSISANSWLKMADATGTISAGGSLAYAGGDYIYALRGGGYNNFLRYSIPGAYWDAMNSSPVPAAVSSGGSLVYPGSGDYIYALVGNGTKNFYRYSISASSWSPTSPAQNSLQDTPDIIGAGGSLAYAGGDYIYALQGNGTGKFYRYSISANSWEIKHDTPSSIGNGGSLVYPGSGDYIYALRGGNTIIFYRYSILGDSWTTMPSLPTGSNVYFGGSLASNGPSIPTPPSAPTALTAAPFSPSQINLSWTAPLIDGGSPLLGYNIERGTDGISFPTLIQVGLTPTSYSNTGLQPGTTYYYRIRARNAVGPGNPSSTASASTPITFPGQPVLTVNTASSSQINLSWTVPSDGGSPIDRYDIERVTNGTTFPDSFSVNPPNISYSNTGLQPGTTYYYRVRAHNQAGFLGIRSNVASATTDFDAPGQPTNLTANPSSLQIDLSWSAPSNNGGSPITGYKIERESPVGGGFLAVVDNTGTTTTTYSDTGLTPGTQYNYRVSARNLHGPGVPSDPVSATTTTSASDAPTDLIATRMSSSQIHLVWAEPLYNGGSPITGYKIERESPVGGGFLAVVDNTGTTTTTYSDTGLTPGTQYNYKVRAVNGNGPGSPSNTANATTSLCGNGVVEPPEEFCDTTTFPGEMNAGGCSGNTYCIDSCSCSGGIIWETNVWIMSVQYASNPGTEAVVPYQADVTVFGPPSGSKTNLITRANFDSGVLQQGASAVFTFQDISALGDGSDYTLYVHYRDSGTRDYWFNLGTVKSIFDGETNKF